MSMILIPQYRTARRRAAAADISILEQKVYSTAATSIEVVFDSVPGAGEIIVVALGHTFATPGISSTPSGFGLRLSSNVTRTVRLYDKTAGSEGNSYTFAGSTAFTIHAFRLSGGSFAAGGTNSGSAVTSIALSSSGLTVPTNAIGIGLLCLGSTGTPTNSDSYATQGHGSTTRCHTHYREYTTGGGGLNCTPSWANGRTVDSLLGIYAP